MKKIITVLAIAACLVCAATASAGVILQDNGGNTLQIDYAEPIGQSFIAEDQHIKFAFSFLDFNSFSPLDALRMRLVSGDGPSETALGSVEFTLVAGFDGFFDVDFSGVTLIIGNAYTALVDIPGTSERWGVSFNRGDVYLNGRGYDRLGIIGANDDLKFRVTPALQAVPGEVPEPASIAIVALGLVGLYMGLRKTK